MLLSTTVIPLFEFGTEEAKVHSSSSSSFAALFTFWDRLEVGTSSAPPSKSTVPDAVEGGFTDCWYWKGEPCRDVEARAAKGSGERAGATEDWASVEDGSGDLTWGGVGVGPDEKRSVIAWLEALCGTGIPDNPRTFYTDVSKEMKKKIVLDQHT